MNAAQSLLNAGFSHLRDTETGHGIAWTFGSATFPAWRAQLRNDDPRMAGMEDNVFPIQCLTDDLPATKPVRGSKLSDGTLNYRVVKINPEGNGTTIIILAP